MQRFPSRTQEYLLKIQTLACSESTAIKLVQNSAYLQEIEALRDGNPIQRNSQLLH